MKAKIYPSLLRGEVIAPSSKSYTHRALLASAFSSGKSTIFRPLISDDIEETIACLKKLGAKVETSPEKIIVNGIDPRPVSEITLEIPASGSTLRMLVPILSTFSEKIEIKTTPRMLERIKTPDLKQLTGLEFNFLPDKLAVEGKLKLRSYRINPIITTQWLSGMILALPFLPYGTEIITDHSLFGNTYPALTAAVAKAFGIKFDCREGRLKLLEKAKYQSTDYYVEGDYSAAANWLLGACFSGDLKVGGLNPSSLQPDFLLIEHLFKLGYACSYEDGFFTCRPTHADSARLDISQTPDLFPVLSALAATGERDACFTGIEKLKYKESDRVRLMTDGLLRLGAEVQVHDDEVRIRGRKELAGDAEIESAGDHRIIMAFMVLSGRVKKPYVINDCQGVSKSYPEFMEIYRFLGGKTDIL